MSYNLPMSETDHSGFVWLIEQGFASEKDYLEKLRIIRVAMNEAVQNGWLYETTLPSECRTDNPHHFHTFAIKAGVQLVLDVMIRKFVDNESKSTGYVYSDITEIKLGHPCALLFIGVKDKVLDYVIASSQIDNMAFRIDKK